ncbi:helix-turn-helix transcriptional regulator [Terasakiella sp. SH-1]|uniref:helix-turn-helix domain-containing protein n=1 Tax=Terasakiella sp. SH-1 TaxID=2560057 RepID=UPI001073693F|nr:helix-turn-helix transcriptional regulator [Terasakiella sp. SH-1]
MTNTLNERLRKARHILGLSAREMAEQVGLGGRSSWERYERGENEPKASVLIHLSSVGINPVWLLSGRGNPVPTTNANKSQDALDSPLLQKIISELENCLLHEKKTITPEIKALIIKESYLVISQNNEMHSPQNITNIICSMVRVRTL